MNKLFPISILIIAIFVSSTTALVQGDGELTLTVSRDFGYSSGTGRIQGQFSMRVTGPGDLVRVVFLIDDQPIGEDREAPFSIQFHTGDYSLGVHSLSAKGYTQDGRELLSNVYRQEFVSAEEGWQTAIKIAGPILGIAFLSILLFFLLPSLRGRRNQPALPLGAPRSYGILGGTICPKCGRPFGIHLWGINLLVGKLDRCPHCGRWSVVTRVSGESIQAAEAAELEQAKEGTFQATQPGSPESLHKELDDSRFLDQ
jgi:hypothetical protein